MGYDPEPLREHRVECARRIYAVVMECNPDDARTEDLEDIEAHILDMEMAVHAALRDEEPGERCPKCGHAKTWASSDCPYCAGRLTVVRSGHIAAMPEPEGEG